MNNRYRTLPYDMIAKVMELDVEETEKKVFLDYLRGNKLNMEAKDKFSAFCEFVMKDEKKINRETGMGYPIILQDFHLEWCDLLQETPRLIIFSPRETGKSSLLSVAYPIWRLGNDPNLRIAIVSSASHQSKRMLSTIKQYIMANADLRKVFPSLKPLMDEVNVNKPKKWSLEQIIIDRALTSKDASIVSYGVGSRSILGSRFDLVLLDDVLGPHNTGTQTEIVKVIEWYSNVLEKCLVEDGQIVCIGTAWQSNDLMHYLEKKDGWKCVKYSFEKEDQADNYRWVDWRSRHSLEKLEKEKKNDIVSYNRNRRCRTSTTEERPFDENFQLVGNRDYDIQDVKKHARKFMGVDLATKKRRGTAITVVGTDGRLNYVLDVVVGAWKISEKVAKIKEYYDIYQPELIYVENNALQDDIVDAINVADDSNLPIKPFTTGSAKHSSIERLAMELDNDKWRFNYPSACQDVIDGKSVDDSDWSRFLLEIKMYPDYPSNDMLMSWMFASEALKKNTARDIQIGLINLNDDDDDFFDRPTHVFGFKDYQLGNRISLTRGVITDKKYQPIISYIKSDIRENQVIRNEADVPYDFKEFMSVFEDMTYFCDTMNGKRLH